MTDEELIEQVARAIAAADGLNYDEVCGVVADPDNGECDSGTCLAAWDEDHDFDLSRRHYQHRARAILPIIKDEVDKWREPIIDELMSCHIYRREHEADPRKALHEVITWNCRVALDPGVPAEARALMVRGGEMVREAAAAIVERLYLRGKPHERHPLFIHNAIRALSVPAIVEAGDADL